MRGTVVGAVVDAVADVVALPADAIRPAPQVGASGEMDFITGIASVDNQMLILADIERLLEGSLPTDLGCS